MKLILAADENWGIGYNGNLLTSLPGDMKFFRETTMGKVMVMGRATLESLPGKKGLPKRINIVLTRKENYKAENALVLHSKEELFEEIKKYNTDDVFVMGGADLYKQLLPYCDTCYITKIYKSFEADRFFVNMDEEDDFEIIYKSDIKEENDTKYQFVTYERKKK